MIEKKINIIAEVKRTGEYKDDMEGADGYAIMHLKDILKNL